MVRIENYFDDLFFTESTLGVPLVEGNVVRVPVYGLFPIRNHPLLQHSNGPVHATLVFEGVVRSERILVEYIGDPKKPEGFRDQRREKDGPFPYPECETERREFGFEGFWETPPAWIEDWVIEARNFALEIANLTED